MTEMNQLYMGLMDEDTHRQQYKYIRVPNIFIFPVVCVSEPCLAEF